MNVSLSTLKVKLENIIKVRDCAIKQVRYRRPNTRRPLTHFQRELVKEVSKPVYVKPWEIYSQAELCGAYIKARLDQFPKEYYPYDQILGEEVREKLLGAKFIAIFHCNPFTGEQLYDLRYALNKLSLEIVTCTKTVINLALHGTPYEPLLKLFEERSFAFVSQEPKVNFSKLLRMEKKHHIVTLIGGVYEGRMISVNDMQLLSIKPNIESHLEELCAILSQSAQKLSSNLIHHQTDMSQSLQRYITDRSEASEEASGS